MRKLKLLPQDNKVELDECTAPEEALNICETSVMFFAVAVTLHLCEGDVYWTCASIHE